MSHVYDLTSFKCMWCGMSSEDTRVFSCPNCGLLTCRECVRLSDEGTYCEHTTAKQRGVVTRQDWGDDVG